MRRSISILKPLAVNAVYNTSMKMNCKQKHNERRGCAGCSYRGQQRAEKCGKIPAISSERLQKCLASRSLSET